MRKTLATRAFVLIFTITLQAALAAAERNEVRVLYDFEDPAEVEDFKTGGSENSNCEVVQDNVSSGKNCCRVAMQPGQWASLIFNNPAKLKDWDKFEYFAMDVFSDREELSNVAFEVWDMDSKDYATRCTYEHGPVHLGPNTLLWRFDKSKRNNKEGLEWKELAETDKIRLNALKQIKIIFKPFAEGNTIFWIDRLRLLQEDAVGSKMEVAIPEGAIALKFGTKNPPKGFQQVGPKDPQIEAIAIAEHGKLWPDTLTGYGLFDGTGEYKINCKVPADGEYWVWLSAAPVFDPKTWNVPFILQVGEHSVRNETLTQREFYGEKGIYRHVRTQYSERPNALWKDYVVPEAGDLVVKAKASGGVLPVLLSNYRIAAMLLMPLKDEAAFNKVVEEIRAQRIKQFYNQLYFPPREKATRQAEDGAFVVWVPKDSTRILPWIGPSAAERQTKRLDLSAAIGQRVVARFCVTPFEDLGSGDIEVSELKGPAGAIPATSVRKYYQNYRVHGTSVEEMALLPWTRINFEKQITWVYWLWLSVPENAAPGAYQGSVTFKPEKGAAFSLPLTLEVYPFKLEAALPVSFGMYYSEWEFPEQLDGKPFDKVKVLSEQFRLMREFGMTATGLGAPRIFDVAGGRCDMRFNLVEPIFKAAKQAGFGQHPEQLQMVTSLGLARRIARCLHMNAGDEKDREKNAGLVDREPGVEFKLPELKGYYQNAIKQFAGWIKDKGNLPCAWEVVDEPREMPNPWNRNALQSGRYAEWMHQAVPSIKNFVTFMGDMQSGKDYTPLADKVDIVSVHATPHSAKLIQKAQTPGKTLWIYNTGMDRLSWGFYNWRMNSKGRWEWHWCSGSGNTVEGFTNPVEWYTPFTANDGFALRGSLDLPGACLFKSVYLTAAQGIADYAYLYTCEQALAQAKDKPEKAAAVAAAQQFLDELKKNIPEFPGIKNMKSSATGALVGSGLDTPVADMTEGWRRKLAELIIALKK